MRLISRIAVLGVPSSASRWISFNATISEVVLDRPYSVSLNDRWLVVQHAHLVDSRIRALAELLELYIVPARQPRAYPRHPPNHASRELPKPILPENQRR